MAFVDIDVTDQTGYLHCIVVTRAMTLQSLNN